MSSLVFEFVDGSQEVVWPNSPRHRELLADGHAPVGSVPESDGVSDELAAYLDGRPVSDEALPERLSAASLSATYATKASERTSLAGSRGLCFAGDSNTANGVTGAGSLLTAPALALEDSSWVTWALVSSGGRFHVSHHAATAGITPAGWNTAYLNNVIAAAPWGVVDALGTNNVENLSQQTAALTTMYDALDAAGIKVIVCTIPPKTGFVADVQRLNRWKQATARDRGYLFVDNYAAVVDSTTGLIAAANDSGDSIHWNATGAKAVGQAFGAALSALLTDVSRLAIAQPSPADLINKPLLLVKSGFVPEDWTSLGYGSAGTAVNTVSGVVGKMFEVTQTATGNNTSGGITLTNLVAGHRYRLGFKYAISITGAAPTQAAVRLVVATGGGTTLAYMNLLQNVPLGTVMWEFVVPSGLSAYNYQLRMSMNGGGIGTKQSIGQVTMTDLTASGL